MEFKIARLSPWLGVQRLGRHKADSEEDPGQGCSSTGPQFCFLKQLFWLQHVPYCLPKEDPALGGERVSIVSWIRSGHELNI